MTTFVEGIDVSYVGQGKNVDWLDQAQAGTRWASPKIGQGNGFVDPAYQHNLAGCRANNILVMPYFFLAHDYPAKQQATQLLGLLDRQHNKDLLLPAVDVEPDPQSTHALRNGRGAYGTSWPVSHMVKLLDDFLTYVRDGVTGIPGLGKNLTIYSYSDFWRNYMGNTHNYANACPLWDASYNTDYSPARPPAQPIAWGGWPYFTFWQYSDRGHVGKLYTDRDEFKGSIEDLRKFANY